LGERRQKIVSHVEGSSVNQLEFFKVGETYSNDQIRFSLDVENLGGIRPALDAQVM